jgi:tRNA pseudouridine38-40 synthase
LKITAEIIKSQSEFIAFTKKHGQSFTYTCTITESKWELTHGLMIYTVQSNRFLRGMVRALVATQLQVALGNLSIEDFKNLFIQDKIASAEFGAPGHGLTLMSVNFPHNYLGLPILDSVDSSKI